MARKIELGLLSPDHTTLRSAVFIGTEWTFTLLVIATLVVFAATAVVQRKVVRRGLDGLEGHAEEKRWLLGEDERDGSEQETAMVGEPATLAGDGTHRKRAPSMMFDSK